MPVIYPEVGMPGLLLKQMRDVMPGAIDTFKVQLIPLRTAPTAKISGPEDVSRLVREMEDYDRESAKIIHLDTKNQIMGIETISIGSLSASIVHPRETVTGAILNKSANVIFVHNHPSGVCEPSQEDINISEKLKGAFEMVGIVLLDSIIVGKGCHYSLRELGFITGKPYPATPGMVREPRASHETKGKVDFITAMTGYITAPDLIRRKRAAEKIQVSKYFKPWFDEFFYEHDRESAKRKLMKFFAANEQGLGLVNHTYYGVIQEYLGAISKQVLTVREAVGAEQNPCERIKEIKVEQQKLSKELADAYRAKDNTRVKKLVETGHSLRAEWDSLTGKCQEMLLKQMKGTVSEKIAGQEEARQIWLEDAIYDYIINKPDVDSVDIVSHFKLRQDITLNALAQLVKDRKVERKWLGFRYGYVPLTEQKSPSTVSENIQTAGVPTGLKEDIYLITNTVDTSRAFPIPESLIIGAAIPEKGFLFAYHVTDDPRGVMQKLKSNIPLCQLNPAGDLGCGFYVSGVPEYWRVRSTMKWEFAKNLTRAQRQSLVTVILSDPNYKKGGGYLADFEVDYLNRDLKRFVETGDVNLLAGTGSQPYNVHITKEIARKAGVPEPKEPGFIKIKLQGKFINAAGLYSNQEIVNRAKAWAVINRPKLLEWNKRVSTQNVVNAWLCSMGYCGAFTKSGFSTNPEMVIWGRKAIIDAWIPEPQQT